ncbi:hypothetical protein [Janibacter anophelis]|uniref:hypothetical protein n=1 Tax=Janibacter anophelis TaxID=319054 RepID=UPI0013B06C9C|nr:hypothetical protein [Janibacter anophelis]
MRRPAKVLMSTLAAAAVVVSLSGCDRWSSKCDTDNTCEIMIQGDKFHEFPRPYDASEGLKSNGAVKDRIRLVSATEGGEALIQAGGVESTCTQGSSFVVVDTTITCDVVGDDRVELTTTRT